MCVCVFFSTSFHIIFILILMFDFSVVLLLFVHVSPTYVLKLFSLFVGP